METGCMINMEAELVLILDLMPITPGQMDVGGWLLITSTNLGAMAMEMRTGMV